MKVLLIEDDARYQQLFCAMLSALGHKTCVVSATGAAEQVVASGECDAILLDVFVG